MAQQMMKDTKEVEKEAAKDTNLLIRLNRECSENITEDYTRSTIPVEKPTETKKVRSKSTLSFNQPYPDLDYLTTFGHNTKLSRVEILLYTQQKNFLTRFSKFLDDEKAEIAGCRVDIPNGRTYFVDSVNFTHYVKIDSNFQPDMEIKICRNEHNLIQKLPDRLKQIEKNIAEACNQA